MKVIQEQYDILTKRYAQAVEEAKFATTARQREISSNELKSYDTILNEIEILENPNSKTITLGSKFSVTMSDYGFEQEGNYVISESAIGAGGYEAVLPNSPMGKAVLGKHEGDHFTYDVVGKIYVGSIGKIYTAKQKTI